MKAYFRCPICRQLSNGKKCQYCTSIFSIENRAQLRHNVILRKNEIILVKLLTTKQVAEIISERSGYAMSTRQVQREIKEGYIKAEKIGDTYMIKESALKNYQRRHRGVQGKK